MPIRLNLPLTLTQAIAVSKRPLIGGWVVSGSPVAAEIMSGSGLDILLLEGEHAPTTLETLQQLLQIIAAYPVVPLVRIPVGETALIKQVLDIGAQNLLIPMVDTAEQAEYVVQAAHYPPRGIRGVGSALARSGRWNRVDGYLQRASDTISITVQIESATAVENAASILAVDGVDAVFMGPSDLAASIGHIGQQDHPSVVAAVEEVFRLARAAGKPVGVNAFDPAMAARYLDRGADFVLVGADVALLARASEALADRFIIDRGGEFPIVNEPWKSY